MKTSQRFSVQCEVFITVLYLSSTLCHHCASVFLSFHQSQESPVVRSYINRKPTEEQYVKKTY